MRVLIVEDERKVADALADGLCAEQYEVAVERTGEGAFFRSSTETFDLILLDLGLPDRDGLEVLAAIRQASTVPVIIVTARDGVDNRVRGFECGADDYVVKPFAFAELLARMRSVMRRRTSSDASRLVVGTLAIDGIRRRVARAGQPITLTAREFDLLDYLTRADGQVVSRDTIARNVWQETVRDGPLDNVIDVHIARLRRKLDGTGLLPLIHTIRGVGFRLHEGNEDDHAQV